MIHFSDIVDRLKRTEKIKIWLSAIMIYLSVAGLVTFSLFIHEEAIQTTMFGTWPAKSAKQWPLVLQGVEMMRNINRSAKIINYAVGWVQPLAFFSYRAYAKATDYYILGVESQVFAHAPELFIGREVNFVFLPKRIEAVSNGKFILTNGRLAVMFNQMPVLEQQILSGTLVKDGKYLMVVQ